MLLKRNLKKLCYTELQLRLCVYAIIITKLLVLRHNLSAMSCFIMSNNHTHFQISLNLQAVLGLVLALLLFGFGLMFLGLGSYLSAR